MTETNIMTIEEIPLSEIYIDDNFNTRGHIDPLSVRELAESIKTDGLIQPVTVQPYHNDEHPEFKYRLLAGFRRSMAHRLLRYDKIMANIRTREINEVDALVLNITENLNRQELNILQEAKALERLRAMGLTLEEIGKKLGQSLGWVQPRVMLLNLPDVIQVEVANGVLSQRHIRELYTIHKHSGADRAIAAAREIKTQIANGTKNATANLKKLRTDTKFKRGQRDISALLEHLTNKMDPNVITAVLAWIAGNITTDAMYDAIEEYAGTIGEDYSRPSYNIFNREAALIGRIVDGDAL